LAGDGQDNRFLGFEVLQEPWNIYKLSDETILKVKFVLQKIRIGKNTGGGRVMLANSLLMVVEVPERLRGAPGPSPKMDEINKAIVEPEVGFEIVKESETVYSFSDGGLMKVKTKISHVWKTSLYGPDGDPIYKVETTHEIAIMEVSSREKSPSLGP